MVLEDFVSQLQPYAYRMSSQGCLHTKLEQHQHMMGVDKTVNNGNVYSLALASDPLCL